MEAAHVGAQTVRRQGAGPVRILLRGWDSPAALLQIRYSNQSVSFVTNIDGVNYLGGFWP